MRDIITKLEELNVEKQQLDEGHMSDMAHEAEKDHEVQMARSDLYKAAKYAVSIHKMMKDVSEMQGIDGWVASKITKASDYLGSVKHYMEGQAMQDVELAVVPVAGDMTDAMTLPEGFAVGANVAPAEEGPDQAPGKVIAVDGDKVTVKFMDGSTEVFAQDELFALPAGLKIGEEVAEGRMSMRQLASMDKDAARKIEAMVGDESKYADMGDYQEALYNAARKLGLVSENIEEAVISEDREVMVKATNIEYDGPALDKLPTDKNVKVMVPAGADDEDVYEMVAEKIEDQHGVKVSGFDMAFMEQDAIEEEDVIGDIIASLSKTKERMPMPKSKPAVPMQSKQKMANKMALPKSKPDMSMGQDKTTGDPGGILRQSKFSEWSKK
jgi:hypothetical protein